MPDTSESKVEYIETNESTPDAADKFWEIEVTKADVQKEVGEDYFTDNTYTYLRLGTIENNTVYLDQLKVDRALGDSSDLRGSFEKLRAALQDQATFIDTHLDKQRAEIDARLPLMRAEKARAVREQQPYINQRTALEAEKASLQAQRAAIPYARGANATRRRELQTQIDAKQAEIDAKQVQIDAKQAEIDYFQERIDELEAERAALPADAAALIASLEAAQRDHQQNPTDTAKADALSSALAAAADGAKTARRQSSTATEKDRGDDLAALIVDYYDDYRYRGVKGEPQCYISEAEREQESARIHTKGGWRDHTNGNRISTTRGDKVEVVRGNYSMVVLGRQDEAGSGTKWESGGGHYARENDTLTPGAVFEIRWVRDPWGGTWRCIEETTKGDVISRYHGNVEERFLGDTIMSTTGSETAGVPIGGDGARRTGHTHPTDEPWISSMGGPELHANPTITEKTWASKIDSQTGSAACPVPEIKEVTWARETSEETHVLGTSMSQSFILNQVEHTINGAANSSMTIAPVMSSLQITGAQFGLDITFLKLEMSIAPIVIEIALAALKIDMDYTAFLLEIHGGNKYELTKAAELVDSPVVIRNSSVVNLAKSVLHIKA